MGPQAMSARPLVLVRASTVWTRASDYRQSVRTCEPLVIDALGYVWTATGSRDARGRLLYQIDGKRYSEPRAFRFAHAVQDARVMRAGSERAL